MEGFAFLGFILFGFIIFSIYFIIKQIDFVLNAIPLYREILDREDKIINILQVIKQHHKETETLLRKIATQQLEISLSEENIEQAELLSINPQSQDEGQQIIQGEIIEVYTRYTDEENAKIIRGQNIKNDVIPIKVQSTVPFSPSNFWKSFKCPRCNKIYSVNANSPNVQFKCIKCQNSILAIVNKKDGKAENESSLTQRIEEIEPKKPIQYFKVVFSGDNHAENVEEIKNRFINSYHAKYTTAEITHLFFSGKPVAVKSHLKHDDALKFQENMITRIGGKFTVEPM